MTKREYIQKAMQLRPTAKQWREYVMRAVNYNNCTDYKNAESGSFRDVRPLAGAIHERLARYNIYGSTYPSVRRKARRRADIIHSCV